MRHIFLLVLLTTSISYSAFAQECPKEKPVIWIDGNCITCEETKTNLEKMGNTHSKDPNDFFKFMNMLTSAQENCQEATQESAEEEVSTQAINGECPDDKPLIDNNGNCRSCDDPLPISMPFDKLNLCEQACLNKTNRYQSGPYCLPKKCPDETPIMDSEGNCHSCTSVEESINAVTGCDNCKNRFSTGAWFDNGLGGISCQLKENNHFYEEEKQAAFDELTAKNCPDDKPILDENGNCIPCLYHHDVNSIKGCEKCPNREITTISASPYTYFYTCEMKEDE